MSSMMPPAPNQNYPPPPSSGATSAFNPQATYQHIQEMARKRIKTLDYLRKTHEGRVYWYNTLLFSRADLLKLPSFSPQRLARRATNLLLLGISLPATLDLNANSPLDYLRALDALLREFEQYQQMHPVDGSAGKSGSSLSRGSLSVNRLFSSGARAVGVGIGSGIGGGSGGGKGRRSSSAADIGAPIPNGNSSGSGAGGGVDGGASGTGSGATANGGSSSTASTAASTHAVIIGGSAAGFGGAEQELLPGEEYAHLLTPSLPFDPDFFEVFATLCDVLIDTYTCIGALVSAPERVAPGVAESFAKADARMRKVIVSGVVKEFEEATKGGVKSEMRGVSRVVLGGLM